MALTESTMMPLGTRAPDFQLPEPLTNRKLAFADTLGKKGTLVIFMCNHCPFVLHLLAGIVQLTREVKAQGINTVAISANDIVSHPADAPDKMAELARREHFSFPYLYDETQATARAYGAACTPDFFLFDADLACVYRGRFDGATPGNKVPVTGEALRGAIDALLNDQPVSEEQLPSMGCNIKWKP